MTAGETKSIIYYSRFAPTIDKGGGARRMVQIYEIIKQIDPGFEFASSARADWIPKKERKKIKAKIRDKKFHSSLFIHPSIKKWSADHMGYVYRNRVISEKWSELIEDNFNYRLAIMDDPIYFAPLFKALIKKKIPVVAALQNIESLSPDQVKQNGSVKLFEEELEILSQCRLVITISREEDIFLRNLGVRARYLPYYPVEPLFKRLIGVREARENNKDKRKEGILMVGNSKNLPTREGMKLAAHYWRQNHLERLGGKLIIGGFNTETFLGENPPDESTEFRGTLSHEDLDQLLRTVKACLCYQKWGSGALTRICEMLTAGIPVIASSHAARSYYNLPGLIEFRELDDLENALRRLDGMNGHIPVPVSPDTSLLIAEIRSLLGSTVG